MNRLVDGTPLKSGTSAIDLDGVLRRAGLRATRARRAIWLRLTESSRPLSHFELTESLPAVESSTIFRALRDFCYCGLAKRADLGDGVWRYETCPTEAQAIYARFVCERCGRIESLEEIQIEAIDIEIASIVLKGRCLDCLTKLDGAVEK